ncbi:hypothetical protein Salmi_Mp086 (mitochondrion) [Salvia miltiorrhiza]|uniref:Uncharacterized protein n=1 Tax=Salvia miltiorrhiza TaxID=226208 RepID=V9P585_SALMI|nr:hypothetical protein Salmi_Mp032 [Salvia miltiorrhiza]YP_008992350.1 hypothetical protein Salmi_Mp086 [Salvia miltiorrhiza]AGU16565.1 hypothetical protein Salmi_Mp032 [Salvia miltiorrhiza]AGU16614.1 hypothetical protein Salmi_Mp086 [Salvia miltiorrhiza]
MHATRKLVFPSGPIDVTGTFQVESEAISNAGRFLFCAIPHLEIHAEHMEFDALLPHSKSMWTSHKGTSARKRFRWKDFQTTHPRGKKASFQPCSLFRGQSSELRKSCLLFIGKIFVCWYQPRKKILSSPIWFSNRNYLARKPLSCRGGPRPRTGPLFVLRQELQSPTYP